MCAHFNRFHDMDGRSNEMDTIRKRLKKFASNRLTKGLVSSGHEHYHYYAEFLRTQILEFGVQQLDIPLIQKRRMETLANQYTSALITEAFAADGHKIPAEKAVHIYEHMCKGIENIGIEKLANIENVPVSKINDYLTHFKSQITKLKLDAKNEKARREAMTSLPQTHIDLSAKLLEMQMGNIIGPEEMYSFCEFIHMLNVMTTFYLKNAIKKAQKNN